MIWVNNALVVAPYFIGLCLDEKQFRKTQKAMGIPRKDWGEMVKPGADATCHTFIKGDGSLAAIVTIGPHQGKTIQQVHALLVHEAVHIWQNIRREIGEDSPSKEFEAYSIQSISQRLMEAYEELTAKSGKKAKK
ncbi:hypothetical protein [Herbaspirillum aquaticum]|uniref:hypothetical protein n=1 Tax=Herbaspirillum aquaticum TaxID=568783 RepID=UPI0024DE5794|nr:hypothetical protein [Herbaspirillum aquaticum]